MKLKFSTNFPTKMSAEYSDFAKGFLEISFDNETYRTLGTKDTQGCERLEKVSNSPFLTDDDLSESFIERYEIELTSSQVKSLGLKYFANRYYQSGMETRAKRVQLPIQFPKDWSKDIYGNNDYCFIVNIDPELKCELKIVKLDYNQTSTNKAENKLETDVSKSDTVLEAEKKLNPLSVDFKTSGLKPVPPFFEQAQKSSLQQKTMVGSLPEKNPESTEILKP